MIVYTRDIYIYRCIYTRRDERHNVPTFFPMIPRKVNNRGTDWMRERERGGNEGKEKRVMVSKYDDDDRFLLSRTRDEAI